MADSAVLGAFLTVNETLYLYHYGILEKLVELVLYDKKETGKRESMVWWIELPSSIDVSLKSLDVLESVLQKYKVHSLFVSGIDPINDPILYQITSALSHVRGVTLGITASCVRADDGRLWRRTLEFADYLSLYVPLIQGSSRGFGETLSCLEDIIRKSRFLEVHVHPDTEKGFLENVLDDLRWETPLHIYGREPLDSSLKIKNKVSNIYRHPAVGDELSITRCPGCGEIVVTRINRVPNKVLLKDGNCPFCGKKVLYKPPGKTPDRILKRMVGQRVVIPWVIRE